MPLNIVCPIPNCTQIPHKYIRYNTDPSYEHRPVVHLSHKYTSDIALKLAINTEASYDQRPVDHLSQEYTSDTTLKPAINTEASYKHWSQL